MCKPLCEKAEYVSSSQITMLLAASLSCASYLLLRSRSIGGLLPVTPVQAARPT